MRAFYTRRAARILARRPFAINTVVPLISFTFDDFPRSALLSGGAILASHGLRGTYYASLGLMGKQAATGTMFIQEDLKLALQQGHEIGCHTFTHCAAGETPTNLFEESVLQNRFDLSRISLGTDFRTFSYPISVPRVRTKQRVARYFACCRGGDQDLNVGTTDLNCLSAYFMEKTRDNPAAAKGLIARNRQLKGWLIFATHDICDTPTPWGCRPDYFADIVQCAVDSGAQILPVIEALETLKRASTE
jgi:peptidoglycan/xylan/chitin deacetylase (PgdA/CDA1 family)